MLYVWLIAPAAMLVIGCLVGALMVASQYYITGTGIMLGSVGFCSSIGLIEWDINHPPWIRGGQVATWMPASQLHQLQHLGIWVMAGGVVMALIGAFVDSSLATRSVEAVTRIAGRSS